MPDQGRGKEEAVKKGGREEKFGLCLSSAFFFYCSSVIKKRERKGCQAKKGGTAFRNILLSHYDNF